MSGTDLKSDNPLLPWIKDQQIISIRNMNADGKPGGSLKVLDKNGRLDVMLGTGRQFQWVVEVFESGEDKIPPKIKLKSRFNGKYLRVKKAGFKVVANGTISDSAPEESIFSVLLGDAGGSTTKAVFQLQCQAYNQEKHVGSAPSQEGTGENSPARNVVATLPGDGTYWLVKLK